MQKNIQILGAGVLVLLVTFLALLYRSFQQKQKNNKLLRETNNLLDKKNKENELLLKEIHHRVKNNLQVISSLLSLQSRSVLDPSVKNAILDSESRVRSMSLIHKKLYKGDDIAAIEMKSYFEILADNLIDAYASIEEEIYVDLEMEELELDVKYAIPLGLIANELITNSLKYAFENVDQVNIKIELRRLEGELVLTITDNGNEASSELMASKDSTGFGSSLIEMLTQQLKGNITQSRIPGFHTQIRFPYLKSA